MVAMKHFVTLCIEGTKGAGKTTTIQALQTHFIQQGWLVEVVAPFALANAHAKALGHDGAVLMFDTPSDHREIVEFERNVLFHTSDAFRTRFEHAAETQALLIYDRGWLTFHAHLFDGVYPDRDWLNQIWKEALDQAPPTVFIHTRPEVTIQRRSGQLDAASGLQTQVLVQTDWQKRLDLVERFSSKVVLSIETVEETRVDTLTPIIQWIDHTL